MDFQIDVKEIKIASNQEKVSQTIEGLLALNDKIPAHTDKEVIETTEAQFDNSDYNNKPSRGEGQGITEYQLDDDDRREDSIDSIQEVQLQDAPEDKGGHRPEMWDKDDEEVRGHRNVAPIWHQVYKQEDDRKSKPMEKKIKKASMDRPPMAISYDEIGTYESREKEECPRCKGFGRIHGDDDRCWLCNGEGEVVPSPFNRGAYINVEGVERYF